MLSCAIPVLVASCKQYTCAGDVATLGSVHGGDALASLRRSLDAAARARQPRASAGCSPCDCCARDFYLLLFATMLPAGGPAAGGGAGAPPPALAPPAIAHGFTRCVLVGQDATLDYVYVNGGAKIVSALPLLGWVDASAISPGASAAPLLAIAAMVAAAAHAEWTAAPMVALLNLSELLAEPTLAFVGGCADALASLGVLDKVYQHSSDFFDAYELALARAPSPSPFLMRGLCGAGTESEAPRQVRR